MRDERCAGLGRSLMSCCGNCELCNPDYVPPRTQWIVPPDLEPDVQKLAGKPMKLFKYQQDIIDELLKMKGKRP